MDEGRKPKKEIDYRRTAQYRKVKKELMEELERNGTVGTYCTSMVDSYMSDWVVVKKLEDDIAFRGVVIEYRDGRGEKQEKKNDSVDGKVRVVASMHRTLDMLGIKLDKRSVNKPKDGDDDGGL